VMHAEMAHVAEGHWRAVGLALFGHAGSLFTGHTASYI
jgi:hypothetical protein